MSLQTTFENAVKESTSLTERPSNQDLLKLYALYKQATMGDNTGDGPTGFDFKGMAKHNAWKELSGMSNEDAMTQYVDLINQLKSA